MVEDLSILHLIHGTCPLLALLINAISQVIVCRYWRGFGLLGTIFTGFGSGFLIVISIEIAYFCTTAFSIPHLIGQLCLCIITYGTLSYCYFHFVNLGETARRIRILRELYDSKDGLSIEDLLNRYNANDIIEKRLKRLLNNGQVLMREGKYFAGRSTMLFMNRVIILMKLIVLGKTSEFD